MPATVTKKDRRSANYAVPSNYREKNSSAGMSTRPVETSTLLQSGWQPSPVVGASTTPTFSPPVPAAEQSGRSDLGGQLVIGMGPKEFREAFQNQLDDRKLNGRDERLFHAGLEAVNEAIRLTGRRPFSSIEDLMDVLVRALNEEFGTSYPNTDEVQRRMAQPSNGHTFNDRVVKALTFVSVAHLLGNVPGAAAASNAISQSKGDIPLYSNRQTKRDALLCKEGFSKSPCTYPKDPRTLSKNILYLNDMGKSNRYFQPQTNYIVVERPDGHMYAVERENPQNIGHQNLAGGDPLRFAGEMHTDNDGKVKEVTNLSGHYLLPPTPYIDPRDCSVHRRDDFNPMISFIERLESIGVPLSSKVRGRHLAETDEGFQVALKACLKTLEIRDKYHLDI